MRNNQPVTSTERRLEADQKLISSTDLHGKIVHCNDDFVAVSGFSREELIGQPHNLVRHPDMPPAAFSEMWEDLKAGRPWMGMVKNRCKNGDYYWVSAYVTPVFSHGELVGYESVRTCPTRALVERAEKVYSGIRSGHWVKRAKLRRTMRSSALPVGVILFTAAGYALNGINGAFQGAALATIFSLVMTAAVYRRSLNRLSELTEGLFQRDL
ncbi:MAG: PAS domain-containing protein, partial [Thalassolituus sp.]